MRLYAFIGIILSIALLVMTNLVCTPLLDASTTNTREKLLITIIMILPLYFLLFSIKVSVKTRGLIEWIPEEERTEETNGN